MKLNLGSSDRHVAGYISVDKHRPVMPDGIEFQSADLDLIWPWDDSSVDEVIAYDIFEHLSDRIWTMNELYRVLKPGATAIIEVPNASKGAGFFQDPTHVSPWCMNSFQYFQVGSFAHQRLAQSYGITARFSIRSIGETSWQDAYEMTWKIRAELMAVK